MFDPLVAHRHLIVNLLEARRRLVVLLVAFKLQAVNLLVLLVKQSLAALAHFGQPLVARLLPL